MTHHGSGQDLTPADTSQIGGSGHRQHQHVPMRRCIINIFLNSVRLILDMSLFQRLSTIIYNLIHFIHAFSLSFVYFIPQRTLQNKN